MKTDDYIITRVTLSKSLATTFPDWFRTTVSDLINSYEDEGFNWNLSKMFIIMNPETKRIALKEYVGVNAHKLTQQEQRVRQEDFLLDAAILVYGRQYPIISIDQISEDDVYFVIRKQPSKQQIAKLLGLDTP